MRAFRFGLDQARRWRASQRNTEKSRVAIAAARLRDSRCGIETRRTQLVDGAEQISTNVTSGSGLVLWAGFRERSCREIKDLEAAAAKAEKELAAQIQI